MYYSRTHIQQKSVYYSKMRNLFFSPLHYNVYIYESHIGKRRRVSYFLLRYYYKSHIYIDALYVW